MQYNLLKELRTAKFPIPAMARGEIIVVPQAEGGIDEIYEPTFDEILTACGEHFTGIYDLKNLQKLAVNKMEVADEERYEAVSTNQQPIRYGHGATMKDALARLFLALNNPTFGL